MVKVQEEQLQIELFVSDSPFLLAILPPGAFIGMGLIIALKNTIDKQLEKRAVQPQSKTVVRARVTTES